MLLGLLGGICYAVYQLGRDNAQAQEISLHAERDTLKTAKAKLEEDIVALKATALTSDTRLKELENQYSRDIGNAELRQLLRLVQERLNAGVKPERLQQVITATENTRNCSAPDKKRFAIKTVLSKDKASSVSFGGGAITITGDGEPAQGPNGAKEAWYDPAKPVTLNFKLRDGDAKQVQGTLPLVQSIIRANTEFKFTINKSAQSYVEVTGDQCAYP